MKTSSIPNQGIYRKCPESPYMSKAPVEELTQLQLRVIKTILAVKVETSEASNVTAHSVWISN
jgi:hypothetical protein